MVVITFEMTNTRNYKENSFYFLIRLLYFEIMFISKFVFDSKKNFLDIFY